MRENTNGGEGRNRVSKETAPSALAQDRDYVSTIAAAPAFGWRDKIGYMLGDLGGNSLQVLVNVYMLLFLVNVIGIEAAHFAVVIAVCRLLDAANDPIIGTIVDRLKGRKDGKYKPWLRWIPIPMALLTMALFVDFSGLPYATKLIYALLVYFCWGVVSSFWNIPYGTMLNAITTDSKERTELSNFRAIGSTGANILVTTVAPLIIYDAYNNPRATGFLVLSVALAVFSVLCLWGTHTLTSERVVVSLATEKQKVDYLKMLRSFARNRPMISIILAYITFKFFVQTINMMNQYVFMSYYKNTDILAAIGLGNIVPLVLGMLMLKPAVNRFGKKAMTTWPVLIAAACYATLAFVPVSPWVWIGFQMLASFFQGFFTLLIWALIADAVDYQTYLTRQRNDGVVYSTVTFVVFMVASLATSFIAIVLDQLGYDPELQANQTVEVANSLRITAGALPAIGCLIVFLLFTFVYNMTEQKLAEVRDVIDTLSDELESEIAEADDELAVTAAVSAQVGAGETVAGRAQATVADPTDSVGPRIDPMERPEGAGQEEEN